MVGTVIGMKKRTAKRLLEYYPPGLKRLGQALQNARETYDNSGLTLVRVEELTGVNKSAINEMENGNGGRKSLAFDYFMVLYVFYGDYLVWPDSGQRVEVVDVIKLIMALNVEVAEGMRLGDRQIPINERMEEFRKLRLQQEEVTPSNRIVEMINEFMEHNSWDLERFATIFQFVKNGSSMAEMHRIMRGGEPNANQYGLLSMAFGVSADELKDMYRQSSSMPVPKYIESPAIKKTSRKPSQG